MLKEVKLVPIQKDNPILENKEQAKKVDKILKTITKYIETGFYFSFGYDLTCNQQRHHLINESTDKGSIRNTIDARYAWNDYLLKEFKA